MTMHKLMTYILGFDPDEVRKGQERDLEKTALINEAVHDYAMNQVKKSNETLGTLITFLSAEQHKREEATK